MGNMLAPSVPDVGETNKTQPCSQEVHSPSGRWIGNSPNPSLWHQSCSPDVMATQGTGVAQLTGDGWEVGKEKAPWRQ